MTTSLDPAFFVEWRKGRGMTQAKLAERLRMSLAGLKKWEGGERKIPAYIGLALAAIDAGLDPVGLDHMLEGDAAE